MASQSARGQQWDLIKPRVWARDNYICQYCGKTTTRNVTNGHPDQAQVDHVTPISKGGSNEMWNLVTACGKCNKDKGDAVNKRISWFNPSWL